jgi:hypothetical protein
VSELCPPLCFWFGLVPRRAGIADDPIHRRRTQQAHQHPIEELTGGSGVPAPPGPPRLPGLQTKRLLIESRWVSKPLAFAGKLRPRRLNN